MWNKSIHRNGCGALRSPSLFPSFYRWCLNWPSCAFTISYWKVFKVHVQYFYTSPSVLISLASTYISLLPLYGNWSVCLWNSQMCLLETASLVAYSTSSQIRLWLLRHDLLVQFGSSLGSLCYCQAQTTLTITATTSWSYWILSNESEQNSALM